MKTTTRAISSRRGSTVALAMVGVLGAAFLMAATPALVQAHHSFAPFDMTSQKTVTGTVKTVEWTNPHSWIWLDVTNGQGVVEPWGFEGMSPNYLARRGWTRTTLKAGDKITVTYRPLRDGSKGGMFMSTKLGDGRTLTMSGATPSPNDR
ncbi:MAG: DUF6152 family protein [Acidobacteriota bacterium]